MSERYQPDKRRICLIFTLVCGIFLAFYEWKLKGWYANLVMRDVVDMIITRMIGGAVFLVLTLYMRYRVINPVRSPFGKSLLITLPCFLVVVTNPPIQGLLFGLAHLNYTGAQLGGYIALFALECFAIGFFEEFAFRSVVLLMIMEKRRKNRKQIFLSVLLSAAVFGAVHLVNLFTAGPGAVFLQIGYSFLIGGMCAFVLIKTANIWLCVLLHAVFDFAGKLVDTLGEGTWISAPIIIFTAVLGVAVAAYVLHGFATLDPALTDRLYTPSARQEQK